MLFKSPLKQVRTEGERQVASAMTGLVVCTVVSQTCAAGTLLILANSLGTAEFGRLSGAMFLQQFFSTMSVSGFRSVVIRELVKRPKQQNEIIGSYLLLSGGIGLTIFFLTAITVWLIPLDSDERVAYLVIALGHIGACLIPNAIYDAKQQQVRGAAIASSMDLLAVGLAAALFASGAISIPIAAFLVAGKWILIAFVSLADHWIRYLDFRPTFDRSQAHVLWHSARMMSMATTLNVAPLSLGVTLTRFMFGAGEAGLFAIGAFVLRSHVTVIGLLTRVVYPYVVGVGGERMSFVRRMSVAYGAVTLLITAAAVVCSEAAIAFCLPSEYQAARATILLLLFAATIRVAGVVGNMYLVAQYRERTLNLIAIAGVVLFALVMVLPLPVSGRIQMALGLLAASGTMAISVFYCVREKRAN